MKTLLLDTHVWAWSIYAPQRVPAAIKDIVYDADRIFLSSVSLFEIGQMVRLGGWPEIEPYLARFEEIIVAQSLHMAALSQTVMLHAGLRHWDHRDPFDRILASTAQLGGHSLVSADKAFHDQPELSVIW